MVAGKEVSPKDVQNTARLMRYWAEGPGAIKIRWGEGNDFYRCVAELGKYVPPNEVDGLCANLHQRATGMTTAEHTKVLNAAKGKGLAKKAEGNH